MLCPCYPKRSTPTTMLSIYPNHLFQPFYASVISESMTDTV